MIIRLVTVGAPSCHFLSYLKEEFTKLDLGAGTVINNAFILGTKHENKMNAGF